jgi:hypothetical protein
LGNSLDWHWFQGCVEVSVESLAELLFESLEVLTGSIDLQQGFAASNSHAFGIDHMSLFERLLDLCDWYLVREDYVPAVPLFGERAVETCFPAATGDKQD